MTKGTATIATVSSANTKVEALMLGYKWNDAAITYSMPTSVAQYGAYPNSTDINGNPYNHTTGFQALNSFMASYMRAALDTDYGTIYDNALSVEGFTNLGLSENTANPGAAQLRGAVGTMGGQTGIGYWPTLASDPNTQMQMGDSWYSNNLHSASTVMHELGHTLGLIHPSDGGLTGIYNTDMYSIMAYDDNSAQSYMVGDIAALQAMYGADYTTNSGNNTYSWNANSSDTFIDGNIMLDGVAANNDVLMTIWDGGGTDTYNLSNYTTSVQIDLRPGGSINLGSGQSFDTGYNSVFNAFLYNGNAASLIENANGGSAADIIYGNGGANTIFGNGGNDTLHGMNDADTLYGDNGADTLRGWAGADVLYGGLDADVYLIEGGGDRILGFTVNVDDIGLSGFGWASEANCLSNATQSSGNTIIWSNDGTRSVILEGVLKSSLDVDDFYFAGALPDAPTIFEMN